MVEKLVTLTAPEDYTSDLESIGSAPDGSGTPAELEVFETVRDAVQVAQYRIGVLSADIERHLLSLRQQIEIRTGEMQATLSLADIEKIEDDLVKARDALRAVLGESGASE